MTNRRRVCIGLGFCGFLLASLLVSPSLAQNKPAPVPTPEPLLKDTPLAIGAVKTFTKLRPRRPVVFTHAGDQSNRIFICTQQGVINVMPNDPNVAETTPFLDLESRVFYDDKQNEQGLLGLAFHPKYKENGEFFLFYNPAGKSPSPSIVSRFRVSKADPNKADPNSEEELLRIEKPFWNHTGGTLAFGPDGMLYIGLGDGGSGNDPQGNGQKLSTLLGKILRIDVDHKDAGLNYAIPKDNPFVRQEGARGEIWASGIRNIWRMAFDRKTSTLWAADVGQDIWEEINLITKGGNYGWSIREGLHKFEKSKATTEAKLIDPIWEYHHNIGKSITGGSVYRGKKLPQLEGCYIYGDYVSGKLWALKYDEQKKEVLANYSLVDTKAPVMTFGEDEAGEIYFTDAFGFIYTFEEVKK